MACFSAEDVERLRSQDRAQIAALQTELAGGQAMLYEQRASLILDEMHHFAALIDRQGVVLECSQTVLDVRQTHRQDFLGGTLWELPRWTAETRESLFATFQHALTTGNLMGMEAELLVVGGETEYQILDMTFKPVCNDQGETIFLVIEGRDITQRRRAEEEVIRKNAELQELYEQLKKLDQLKSMFFAMMNHELRTPLTLILGPTESLLQQPSLTQEVRQNLEVVTRNARLLLKLVNDLLEVSHLESGQLHLHYVSCDLSRMVHLLAANFEMVATERRLTYRVLLPPHLPVEVDAAKIERVVLNLLSNAFKFTPDGGRVTCSLEIPPGDQEAAASSSSVVLTVQDSGPGVPAELRELIFEQFRQTEEGAKRRFGGTGLGLAIVKDLVHLHQGTIHVDEAPGGGACFTIRLPQYAPTGTKVQQQEDAAPCVEADSRLSQATVEELLPAHSASSRPSRPSWEEQERALILIVEDHAQMRQFLAEHLSSQYRVREAANGQEGLTLAREVHPDLILTDIMMPVMSGDEMLIALRADPACKDTPVIVLSARDTEEQRMKMLRAGAQDYLVKPFSPEELQVRLGNLLMLHRTRRLLQEELASSQGNVESLACAMAARSHDLGVLNADLQAMNKQQNNFTAVVSHEFRTALAGIQGFSELLCEQEWSAEEVQEYATDITTDARRLTRLIDEVLDLERMKSGKTVLNREPVDMNALLRKLAKQMQQTTPHHTLVCVLDETLPLVQGDQDKLIQVISNLLSNAVKYAPEGGNIVLSSQHKQDAIQISIQDQGIGIAQEVQKDLFVPYSRIASEQTRYISGSGLGLSVAHEIVRLHGGSIWVESTVGHGSTFSVSLPTPQQTLQPLPGEEQYR
jgi:signal transduction histidine kinase